MPQTEALAALGLVALTYLTLIVLKQYAADTKLIAKASGSQLVGNPLGVSIDYESLSGFKYQTLIKWGSEGSPVIQFNLPPHEK